MLRKIFNVVLLLFCGIVPLVSYKNKVASIPLSADFVLGGLLIFIGILNLINMKRKKLPLDNILKLPYMKSLTAFIGIFLVMSMVSVLYSMNKSAAVSEIARALEYVMIFFAILVLADAATIKASLKTFYVAMIIASIYGVIQYATGNQRFTNGALGSGRIFSTFENPNYWGAAMNLVIFYPVLNILEKRNVKVNIGIFLLFFFNLFFSATRGSWLGFLLGLSLIGLFKYRKLIYYVIGILITMVLLPITRNRFLELMNITSRINVWKTGMYMFLDHFWLGVGNGNYLYEYKKYVKELHPELYMHKTIYSVHNSYLKMLAELGIFGGMTFTLMYLNVFGLVYYVHKFSEKYKRCALAFLCFGVAYLFQNLINNLIFIPQLNVFVWILAALLYKGVLIEKELPGKLKK